MAKQTKVFQNIRLGAFVLSGLVFLVLALYFIGKEEAFFQSNITLHTQFERVDGLVPGNNVWLSGINVGVVKSVSIVNDTTIAVGMAIRSDLKNVIRKNAQTALGTEGIIGNKVVKITPRKSPAPFVQDGDTLYPKKVLSTAEMLETLSTTNNNVAFLSEELLQTVRRINDSPLLNGLLNDPSLAANLRASLLQLRGASTDAATTMTELQSMVHATQQGEGTLGVLLRDTAMAEDLEEAFERVNTITAHADQLVKDLQAISTAIDRDYRSGAGPATALLRDSLMTNNLQQSLKNVEQGTRAFGENMEALKHNFLFRGYFKRQEKKNKKQ